MLQGLIMKKKKKKGFLFEVDSFYSYGVHTFECGAHFIVLPLCDKEKRSVYLFWEDALSGEQNKSDISYLIPVTNLPHLDTCSQGL